MTLMRATAGISGALVLEAAEALGSAIRAVAVRSARTQGPLHEACRCLVRQLAHSGDGNTHSRLESQLPAATLKWQTRRSRDNQYSSTFRNDRNPDSRLKNTSSPQPMDVFDPHAPLPELKDLVLWRGGNLVTAQWRGSPKFSVGVLSTLSDEQAFERAAESMSLAVKPGFKEAEMKGCAKEIRRRAEASIAVGAVS